MTFVRNLKPVVRCAEQFGVILAIEPVARHIVWNAKRARIVLDEIGSHNLQVLFDPVNMLDLDDVDRREEVFAEAMELLGPDIAMVHFKDFIRVNEGYGLKAVGAGTGEMDFSPIMKFIKKEKPFIYGTLENTTPENAEYCGAKMRELYEAVTI